MTGYDIIGDVHGCASQLEGLLTELGYQINSATGEYRHPTRRAVFVGDLIDRGDEQLRVLQIVKAMVDAGCASALCASPASAAARSQERRGRVMGMLDGQMGIWADSRPSRTAAIQ